MSLNLRILTALIDADPMSHRQIAAKINHPQACVCAAINLLLKRKMVRVAYYERGPGKPVAFYDLERSQPNAPKPKPLPAATKYKDWQNRQKINPIDDLLRRWV